MSIMPILIFNNLKIHYLDEGTGVPLILLHGLSDSSDFWKPLINELSKKYRVIVPDLRGHGSSSKNVSISMELFTQDLYNLFDNLKLKNAHIFGFSLGALIAENFSLNYSQYVNSMVLISSFSQCKPQLTKIFQKLKKITKEEGIAGFFDEMVELVYTPEFILDHEDLYKYKKTAVEMNSADVIVQSLNVCIDFNIKKRVSEIKARTLIFSGSEDRLTPPIYSEELWHDIFHSQLYNLCNVGHNVMVTENFDEIMREINKFLK
jgi:pimeloyl-ACP methyl ester carboxylesterase